MCLFLQNKLLFPTTYNLLRNSPKTFLHENSIQTQTCSRNRPSAHGEDHGAGHRLPFSQVPLLLWRAPHFPTEVPVQEQRDNGRRGEREGLFSLSPSASGGISSSLYQSLLLIRSPPPPPWFQYPPRLLWPPSSRNTITSHHLSSPRGDVAASCCGWSQSCLTLSSLPPQRLHHLCRQCPVFNSLCL